MKKILFYFLLSSLIACEDGGGDTPLLPNPLVFTLVSATFNGLAIDPLPNYTLSISYDNDGNITTYTATNSTNFTPTISNSGTVNVTNNIGTFSAATDSRDVLITTGSLEQNSSGVTLQWEMTKVTDGIQPAEQGTYTFEMTAN